MHGHFPIFLLVLLLAGCAQTDHAGEIVYLGIGGGHYSEEEQLEGQIQFVRQITVEKSPEVPAVGDLGFVNVVHEGKVATFRVFLRPEMAEPGKTFTTFESYARDDGEALRYLQGYFKAVNSQVKTKGQVRYPVRADREDGKEDPYVDGFNDGMLATEILER